MSEISMDIKKWEKEYPFLENVWKMYKDFEKNVSDDENASIFFEPTCKVILRQNKGYNLRYNEFCMKLLRNLGAYSLDKKVYKPSQERCNTLNYWLYYKIRDLKFSENILSDIFKKAEELTSDQPSMQICKYNYNKNIREPENIIKLLNLVDNIDKIQRILKGTFNDEYCYCEKYINQCVNIYKNIKSIYCSGSSDKETNSDTCSHLDTFDRTYTGFFSNEQELRDKIPSLTSINNEYVGKCKITQSTPVSISSQQDNSDNPNKISVTGTIGTMAGVSSVLALLYKITPAGSWINSRLRGRSINTNLYTEGASELLFEEPIYENINSYNIGYEAA